VGGWVAGVQDAHLMPGRQQRAGHVGTDETGAAGHEYMSHPPTVSAPAGSDPESGRSVSDS
jgi:hypothetical protein